MRFALFFLPALLLAQSAPPPVVLINGYQSPPCANAQSRETFGQLEDKLRSSGRQVIWFNSCSVSPSTALRPTIEELGAALGKRIAESGAPQVDLIVHSMGGLILRSYLAGKQNAAATFIPPADPRVRKAIFLGTPHFGIGLAQAFASVAETDPQVRALLPGSRFLFDLGTWNQGADNLREIDAIAVAGAASTTSDGLVSLTSASMRFLAGEDRLRIVPYCHTNNFLLALVTAGCRRAPYLAEVDSDDHLSWRIIRSFLDNNNDWKQVGVNPEGPLAANGGLLLSYQDREGKAIEATTKITAGIANLAKGTYAWYTDFVPSGRQDVKITATPEATSAVSITAVGYNVAVIKTGPRLAAVLPAAGRVPTLSRAPGMFVSLYGAELAPSAAQALTLPLPTELNGVRVLANGTPIGLQFVGPAQINAILPETARGLVTLEVRTAGGAHQINVLIDSASPAIFTQNGTGTGYAAVTQAVSGALITPDSPARRGDVLTVYGTGLGVTENRAGLAWAVLAPTVEIGGVRVAPLYAGRAPGFAGLDQVNFVVPPDAPRGTAVPVRLISNGRASNETTLPID